MIAGYVLYEAGSSLLQREAPAHTPIGIVLAAISLVVMPMLGWAKLQTAHSLSSRALAADAKETFVCSYLSFESRLGCVDA